MGVEGIRGDFCLITIWITMGLCVFVERDRVLRLLGMLSWSGT